MFLLKPKVDQAVPVRQRVKIEIEVSYRNTITSTEVVSKVVLVVDVVCREH